MCGIGGSYRKGWQRDARHSIAAGGEIALCIDRAYIVPDDGRCLIVDAIHRDLECGLTAVVIRDGIAADSGTVYETVKVDHGVVLATAIDE